MDILRYTRIAVLTALFLVPATALVVSSSMYFPFITGKNFLFRVLVEVAFAGWVVLALASSAYRPKKSLALWLGLAFLISLGISTIFAENPVKAFWSNFERMEGYVTILHLAAYVVVLTTVLNTEKLWRNLFFTSLSAATVVSVYSVFQLLGAFAINQGGLRIDATFGNATYFAVYMLIHAFLALYAYVRWTGESRWARIALGTLFALFSILVFYSATRGSILGLIGGLVIIGGVVLFSRGVSSQLRNTGIGMLVAILALVGAFFVVKDTVYVQNHPILSRVASISLESGATRFTIWSMALEGARERPVLGWGQEGFNYVFNKYYRPELVFQEPWFDRAHNVILDWLVAGGITGMVLYLGFYLVLLWYLWRPGNPFDVSERAVLTGLIAAYGFHNLFVFDNLLSYVMFMMLFSYITYRTVASSPATGAPQQELVPPTVAAPIALVALLVVLYAVNGPAYASATGIIRGLSPQQEGIAKNLEYFVESGKRAGLGYQEVGEQFLQFATQIRVYNFGEPSFQAATMQSARSVFDGVLVQVPGDARLRVYYGSFLRQAGDLTAARENLEQALTLSPQKQSILLEYGMLDMAEKRYAEAVKHFRAVYDTAPQYGKVHSLLASAAILAGDQELATTLLMRHYETLEPKDSTVAAAYLDSGKVGIGLRIARAIAEESPSVDSYKFLAQAHLKNGDLTSAIGALRRAATIDPRFSQQAEMYIAELSAMKF